MLMPLHSARAPHAGLPSVLPLLDAAAAPCWIVDRDFIIVHANPAMCALLGYSEGEMVGSPVLSFVADTSRRTIDRQVALRDLTPRRVYDVTLLHSDGTPTYTIFNDGTLPDSGGAFIVVTDVSQRHMAENLRKHERDELTDTVERINRFLDLLCRDIKDPLSAILGVAQMLPGCGELCDDAGRQILRMIENLALWSRLQLNQVPCDLRTYYLSGVVHDVVEEMTPIAGRRGIRLVNDVQDAPVLADLAALVTVLRHLVDNAVRFSPEGSVVVLSSVPDCNNVTLRVQDAGIGIPPETLPRLFQLDHAHATTGQDGRLGSGLGLLIARMLAERMGGNLRLESQSGHGTTATVVLRAESQIPRHSPMT